MRTLVVAYKKMKKLKGGFSLIELIMYIALVAIFVSGAIRFAWDVIYSREKAQHLQLVEQAARQIITRINYEISVADSVTFPLASQLTLNQGGTTKTIQKSGNNIELVSGANTYVLNSPKIIVNSLTFTDRKSTDNMSKNVGVNLAVSGTYRNDTKTITLTSEVELLGSFNQGRNFFISGQNAIFDQPFKDITNISLENVSAATLVLDKLAVFWTGTVGGEHLTKIEINGPPSLWNGSNPSSSAFITLSPAFTFLPASGSFPLDLTFDTDMDGVFLTVIFSFTDGSTRRADFQLAGIPLTPTPTTAPPTATPAPLTPTPLISTCQQYCVSLGSYAQGTCRKNSAACNTNSETHQSGGDLYCTGGADFDTCCCL